MLVDGAWELAARARELAPGKVVQPSIPILFFGDLAAYLSSPVRVITVGLNPSLAEFPANDPWRRFPAAAGLAPPLTSDARETYLQALSDYFKTAPYRSWFNRSFEPVLNGLGASYYPAAKVALHTDIASPVATDPTWSRLGELRRGLERDGWRLWRDLAELLAPDVIVVSTAREHLHAITPQPFADWRELARVERERPFVVSGTTISLDGKLSLVAFGRCTNVPFGSVSFADRRRLGSEIAEHAARLCEESTRS